MLGTPRSLETLDTISDMYLILLILISLMQSYPLVKQDCDGLKAAPLELVVFEDKVIHVNIPGSFTFKDTATSWCGNDPETLVFIDSTISFKESLNISWSYWPADEIEFGINKEAREYDLKALARQIGHSRIEEIGDIVGTSSSEHAGWGYASDYSTQIGGCYTHYAKGFYFEELEVHVSYRYQRLGETLDLNRLYCIADMIEKSLQSK